MAVTLEGAVRKRLEEPNYWHLACINEDGTPHVSPTWADVRGDRIVINTATRHLKYKNLLRNPNVAFSNAATDNPFDHIQIRGTIVDHVVGDEAERDCDEMARKYTGDVYRFRAPGEQRATFVIEPTFARHFVP